MGNLRCCEGEEIGTQLVVHQFSIPWTQIFYNTFLSLFNDASSSSFENINRHAPGKKLNFIAIWSVPCLFRSFSSFFLSLSLDIQIKINIYFLLVFIEWMLEFFFSSTIRRADSFQYINLSIKLDTNRSTKKIYKQKCISVCFPIFSTVASNEKIVFDEKK